MQKNTEHNTNDFSSFVVCGYYYNSNKRFTSTYASWSMANMINLWKGNVYGVLKTTGKRVKLKSVTN